MSIMLKKIFLTQLFMLLGISFHLAQSGGGKHYKIDRNESIYLPLGQISFADSIVEYKIGDPPPLKKYRDSNQCLHEPNYKYYEDATFYSLGCKGSLTVAFTNNGFMNLPGNDLYIFEVGPTREAAKIEISENGKDWLYAGTIAGGKSTIDLKHQNIAEDIVFYYLRITDLKDLCKSKSAGADIDAVGAINSVIKLTINADVLFDVAKYDLKKTANRTLDSLSDIIQQVDKANILVEGHTDSDGTLEYNQELSKNRCNSVVKRLEFLLGNNSKYDYDMIPYGETRPKVKNDTDENKQINRRVEITVLPPKDYYDSILERN